MEHFLNDSKEHSSSNNTNDDVTIEITHNIEYQLNKFGNTDYLKHKQDIGTKIAVIGAGGIGFDVSELLTHSKESQSSLNKDDFFKEWGVDQTISTRGGIADIEAQVPKSPRMVYLCQRKTSKIGKGLGKTTGWIHRMGLKNKGVHMLTGVFYDKVDDQGLHITIAEKKQILDVDHVIICAGQVSNNSLYEALKFKGVQVHKIGGAHSSGELDAKRAIKQGITLALKI